MYGRKKLYDYTASLVSWVVGSQWRARRKCEPCHALKIWRQCFFLVVCLFVSFFIIVFVSFNVFCLFVVVVVVLYSFPQFGIPALTRKAVIINIWGKQSRDRSFCCASTKMTNDAVSAERPRVHHSAHTYVMPLKRQSLISSDTSNVNRHSDTSNVNRQRKGNVHLRLFWKGWCWSSYTGIKRSGRCGRHTCGHCQPLFLPWDSRDTTAEHGAPVWRHTYSYGSHQKKWGLPSTFMPLVTCKKKERNTR